MRQERKKVLKSIRDIMPTPEEQLYKGADDMRQERKKVLKKIW